ncbi:hypothetical protein QBC46DRAFT_297140 [Diplogelasinospora grovesii]|uniref:SRR1-like domain-containing protein n=1 Tax=Diplogelasinospora grovesii TaxID=303347 RepID=A0AAN6S0X1_9PEZI|nr:hypothetical protein QBC46DRAFT_297140 [Diplogelasinospora grovesii]
MRWDEERRRSGSMGQHALILTIRDFLAKRGHVVQCYAQDPIYTDIDRQALDEHGITVLDDPKGFLEIDEETVVISQYPDIPVRQITADITRPALMIWNTVKEKPSFPPTRDDDNHIRMIADNTSPRLDKMVQDYVQLDFPQSPVKRDFGEDTTIYIRKMNL